MATGKSLYLDAIKENLHHFRDTIVILSHNVCRVPKRGALDVGNAFCILYRIVFLIHLLDEPLNAKTNWLRILWCLLLCVMWFDYFS